jgi:hypothetical protein
VFAWLDTEHVFVARFHGRACFTVDEQVGRVHGIAHLLWSIDMQDALAVRDSDGYEGNIPVVSVTGSQDDQ